MLPTFPEAAAFSGSIDLASERLGGRALSANDEFFAPKENLLKPDRAVFVPDKYTEFGKWMDGWETRRRRTPGHDWCIVKLGAPGVIQGFDIDTAHFLGNHPPYASVDAVEAAEDVAGETLEKSGAWREALPRVPLKPGSQNLFASSSAARATHVRLNIHPDGGVARLRVYGRVAPDPARLAWSELDLAAIENGGTVVAASDMFFGAKENLIMPGRAAVMGEGWETRRRRGPGNDWLVVALAATGRVRRVLVDTNHFKGNCPDRCALDACHARDAVVDALTAHELPWKPLLPESKLTPDHEHTFERELKDVGACTHVRLSIFPDGGISRLRLWGSVARA
jgi:allantoicase